MKVILSIAGLIIAAGIIWLFLYLSRPDHYGEPFTNAEVVDVRALFEVPADLIGRRLQVHGVVKNQCQATGCYFYFIWGDKKIKIELGDVASRLPKRLGYQAKVEGFLSPFGDGYQFIGSAVEFKKAEEEANVRR